MVRLASCKTWMAEDIMDEAAAMAEYRYWTRLMSGVARSPTQATFRGVANPRPLWEVARFDTSVECISGLFRTLANEAGNVSCSAICEKLMRECKICVSTAAVEEACSKVQFDLHGVPNSSPGQADIIIFSILWQRLMLGAVYSEDEVRGKFISSRQNQVHVIHYGKGKFEERKVTESQWTFGEYFAKTAFAESHQGVTWLRADDALPAELVRMGVKMYFHPLLVENLLSAQASCTTQATCFHEHNCICLELYFLGVEEGQELSGENAPDSNSSCDSASQDGLRRSRGKRPLHVRSSSAVGSRIRRGVVTIVAPTSTSTNQCSVLTFVNSNDEQSSRRSGSIGSHFSTNQAGVTSFLNHVQSRICAHFQLREQPAIALVYIILNSADRQLGLVCSAYAERLSLLRDGLAGGARRWHGRGGSELTELSNTCSELNELLQWVEHLQGVVEDLGKQAGGKEARGNAGCSFGTQQQQQQQAAPMAEWSSTLIENTLQAIQRSKVSLLQQIELVQQLKAEFMQSRQDLGDNALFIFSVIGSSYFPAQFLTGVFGMNFEHMPVLAWRKGYIYFWLLSGLLVVVIPLLIICGLQINPDKRFLMGFSVALAVVLWLATGAFSWEGDY